MQWNTTWQGGSGVGSTEDVAMHPRGMSVGQLAFRRGVEVRIRMSSPRLQSHGKTGGQQFSNFSMLPNHLKGLPKLYYRIPSSNFWSSNSKGSSPRIHTSNKAHGVLLLLAGHHT